MLRTLTDWELSHRLRVAREQRDPVEVRMIENEMRHRVEFTSHLRRAA